MSAKDDIMKYWGGGGMNAHCKSDATQNNFEHNIPGFYELDHMVCSFGRQLFLFWRNNDKYCLWIDRDSL